MITETRGSASASIAKIEFPGIEQKDFDAALHTIEGSRKAACPQKGFTTSYFAPGGYYGEDWWQLDFSLALTGYKWFDQAFCETAILNFETAQREDGRIPLWGSDGLPEGPRFSVQRHEVSSLPKVFDAAQQLVRRSTNTDFVRRIYAVLARYFRWWDNARLDARTGLYSAVFEETFIPYLGKAGEWAAPDTNMELIHACACMAHIANRLGAIQERDSHLARQKSLQQAVVRYLWDERQQAFFPYKLREAALASVPMSSTFMPLRHNTALPQQKNALLKLLTDDSQFGWNTYPVTSVNRTSPEFVVISGNYVGNPCWSGSVWSLLNEGIVRGLVESGEKALAAQLALKTVSIFNHNYAEFLDPLTGQGHGVKDYTWTAAQYIELLLGVIFGLDYDASAGQLTVAPMVSSDLYGQRISLKSHILPNGRAVSVSILCQEVPQIEVEYDGRHHSGCSTVQIDV